MLGMIVAHVSDPVETSAAMVALCALFWIGGYKVGREGRR